MATIEHLNATSILPFYSKKVRCIAKIRKFRESFVSTFKRDRRQQVSRFKCFFLIDPFSNTQKLFSFLKKKKKKNSNGKDIYKIMSFLNGGETIIFCNMRLYTTLFFFFLLLLFNLAKGEKKKHYKAHAVEIHFFLLFLHTFKAMKKFENEC